MNAPQILVLRPGALGDTVVTEPVIASLRAAFPLSDIRIVGRTDYLPLLVGEGLADGCTSMDDAAFLPLFGDGPPPECDVMLAFLPDEEGTLRAKLERPGRQAVVFDPRPHGGPHIVDHLLGALEPLGVPVLRRRPQVACRSEWRDAAMALVGGEYAVVHPGSGGRAKLWGPEKWAAVIDGLRPLPVVVTQGEADDGIIDALLALAPEEPTVVRDQPITTVAGVLARAKAYVGCDSGVTHLAAALGAPTVAIFGPTDPAVWAPRGRLVRVLRGTDGSTDTVSAAAVVVAARAVRVIP